MWDTLNMFPKKKHSEKHTQDAARLMLPVLQECCFYFNHLSFK